MCDSTYKHTYVDKMYSYHICKNYQGAQELQICEIVLLEKSSGLRQQWIKLDDWQRNKLQNSFRLTSLHKIYIKSLPHTYVHVQYSLLQIYTKV